MGLLQSGEEAVSAFYFRCVGDGFALARSSAVDFGLSAISGAAIVSVIACSACSTIRG